MVSTVLVAIPTYLRPERLKRALQSAKVAVAAASHLYDVSIAVIDNDAAGSARAVAKKFGAMYAIESTRGLSAVRNRALLLAHEYDALAFFR